MANMQASQYGAIPLRAFRDYGLHRSDLAVLGVMSYFDRGGKNGAGCYATQKTIAALTACNRSTVCKRQRNLLERGYLRAHKRDKRSRVQYHVVHDADAEMWPSVHNSAAEMCPAGQHADAVTCAAGQHDSQERDPQDTQRHIPDEETSQSAPLISDESDAPPADEVYSFDLHLMCDQSSNARDPAKAFVRNPVQKTAAGADAPAAPDSDCDLSDLVDGDFWAYRRRVSQFLQDRGCANASLYSDVNRILSYISEYSDDEKLRGAFEDLYVRVENSGDATFDAA